MTGPGRSSGEDRDNGHGRSLELIHQGQDLIGLRKPGEAVPLLEQALAMAPRSAEAWNQMGRALNNLRRLADARRALEKAVALAPDFTDAWSNLGHVCRTIGDPAAAQQAFQRAAELDPGSSRVLRDLASVFIAGGDAGRGIELLEQAVAADPGDVVALTRLGDACLGVEDYVAARSAYMRAVASDDRAIGALVGLGALDSRLGRLADAEVTLVRALTLAPGDPSSVSILAEMLEIQGRNEEALRLVEGGAWDEPPGWALATRARLLFKLERRDAAQRLLAGTDMASLDPQSRAAALNVMGSLHDARGEYEGAFAAFAQANRAQPARFDPAGYVRAVDRLIGFFTADTLRRLPVSGCESERPVFIVGMPRSGTSLVEQILAGHSRVHAGGERTALYRLPRRLSGGAPAENWPDCLLSIAPTALADAAREYLGEDGSAGTGATRCTDKLPANFLNLGLAQLLFPRARVVYCRRDPMDTGLSCFQQDFRSPGMDFARDLSHIGIYQQGCRRLMTHWSSVLDLPIHVVDYEALVESPEQEAQGLVRFLGLEWEAGCLEFHRSRRPVRTASHDQVRKPLYRSSVGRWRHYATWLAPLEAALAAPWPGPA
jgi:tetratricopeptide (TPR) repeat protein